MPRDTLWGTPDPPPPRASTISEAELLRRAAMIHAAIDDHERRKTQERTRAPSGDDGVDAARWQDQTEDWGGA